MSTIQELIQQYKNAYYSKYADSYQLRRYDYLIAVPLYFTDTFKELNDSPEHALVYLKRNSNSFQHVSPDLKNNPIFMLEALTINYKVVENSVLMGNKDFVLAALKKNGKVLKYVSPDLQNDKEVVMTALATVNKGYPQEAVLQYASASLKSDPEVVKAGIIQNEDALNYASPALRGDKDVMLAAVTKDGTFLRFASDKLKDDKDVVLAAVNNKGYALEFASEALKSDIEVITDASKNGSCGILYASEEVIRNKLPDLEGQYNECVSKKNEEEWENEHGPRHGGSRRKRKTRRHKRARTRRKMFR